MKRPGYRDAIDWIVRNDDMYWLGDYDAHGPMLSVTASMVRDLFEVSDERLIADLVRKLKQVHPTHAALISFSPMPWCERCQSYHHKTAEHIHGK